MKKIFTTLALMLITLNLITMVPRAFNYDLSKVKPFDNHCFKPHAYLQYHFVPAWANVDIENIVEYLPSWYHPPVMTVKKPVYKVTAIPVDPEEPEYPKPDDPAPPELTDAGKAPASEKTDEAEYLNNPVNQELYNTCFAYDLDRNYENQRRKSNPGALETDETMMWYAKTDHYENSVNRNRLPVDQKTNLKRLNGKIQNKSFITPETMLKVTDVEYYATSSKYTIDFTEPEQFNGVSGDDSSPKEETLYCINRKFYSDATFSIADCDDLLDIADFECDETTWHTFSELDKSIEVEEGYVGIINVLAKKPDGSFIVYDRLFFRWLTFFETEPITCHYFIVNYLWAGGWTILNHDIDCTGEDFALSRDHEAWPHIIGNGHVIKNINISENSCWSLGMLGRAGENSYVANLGIETASLNTGCNSGVLFGELDSSLIENVYVNGAELTTSNGAGGLLGMVTHSRIRKVRVENLDFTAGNLLGGIAETVKVDSVVEDSEVKSAQLSIYGMHIGGVTGVLNGSTILRTSVEDVVVVGGYNAGGLVGTATDAVVSYSKSSGSVHGSGYNSYEGDGVGGLIGTAKASSVTYSSSSVSVSSGENVYNTGGLIGYVNETSHVEHCSASGDVTSLYSSVGGLIGYLANEEYDVQSTVLSNSYATGNVTGATMVGGLVGRADATIIETVYAKGAVTADYTNSQGSAGGLIGQYVDSELYNSFALGNVTACTLSTIPCYVAGGLLGYSTGTVFTPKVFNSYALGDVVGLNRTGLLIGSLEDDSIVNNLYSLGEISASGQYIGGAFGYREPYATVANVYLLSPNMVGAGITLLTEAEFGVEASFIGFNFPNTWEMQNHMMCGDIRRPHLDFEPNYDPTKVCEEAQHDPQR